MKKILSAILCCTFILAMISCGNGASSRGNEASSSKNEASSKYVKMAEGINKNLPKVMFNGMIRFDKTEAASKNEFKFYYTFLIEAEVSGDDEFVKSVKESAIPSFKNLPGIKELADDNMTLTCIYYKVDGSKFAEVKITPDEYR